MAISMKFSFWDGVGLIMFVVGAFLLPIVSLVLIFLSLKNTISIIIPIIAIIILAIVYYHFCKYDGLEYMIIQTVLSLIFMLLKLDMLSFIGSTGHLIVLVLMIILSLAISCFSTGLVK